MEGWNAYMKVHHYDEDYTKRMKTDGRRELNLTLLVGFVVFIIPIVLITLGTISQLAGFLIIGAGIIVFSISLNRSGIFTRASCCVIIEYNNELYYMVLNPNLDQCLLDEAVFKSVNFDADVTVFFEDAYYQPVSDDDKFICLLFISALKNKFKSNFTTFLYGKPMYVSCSTQALRAGATEYLRLIACITAARLK